MKINVEEHLGLAHTVAARFVNRNERVQDTIEFSLACEALVLVSQNYIPEQGAFSSVAYTAMVNKLIDYQRTKNRKKRKIDFECLDDKQWSDRIDEIQWEEQLEDIHGFMGWLNKTTFNDEEKDDIENADLNDFEKVVIRAFLTDDSVGWQTRLANSLVNPNTGKHYSRMWITMAKEKAMEKLRNYLADADAA